MKLKDRKRINEQELTKLWTQIILSLGVLVYNNTSFNLMYK